MEEPENLTARQQSKLADVEGLNRPLYRAYLLKEQLRQIYRLPTALISLAMLKLSGLCPPLPGRVTVT